MNKLTSKSVGLILLGFVVLFLIFILKAFELYPGGNAFDLMAQGHSFWFNFWCDILSSTTINQVPNQARNYAILSGFFLIAALFILGLNSPRIIPVTKKRFNLMLVLGLVSILSAMAMALNHDLFLTVTAVSGLLCFLIFLISIFKTSHKLFFWCGLMALITGSLNFILWMNEHSTKFLPVIQKISTIFLVFWIIIGAVLFMRKKSELS